MQAPTEARAANHLKPRVGPSAANKLSARRALADNSQAKHLRTRLRRGAPGQAEIAADPSDVEAADIAVRLERITNVDAARPPRRATTPIETSDM